MSFLSWFDTFLLYHKTTRFDRETIQNCRREGRFKMRAACALRIISGRIIFNFASPKRLRSFRRCFFTERGRTGKRHLCQKAQKTAGRTPSVKPCGFATSLHEGGDPLRHRCAMPPPPKGGGYLLQTVRCLKAPPLEERFPPAGTDSPRAGEKCHRR